jgi:O-antigen/teichoic acid export membrane protein
LFKFRLPGSISGLTSRSDSSIAASAVVNLWAELTVAAFAFVTSIVTANYLGADGKGQLAYITTVSAIAVLVGSLGIETANIYFAARDEHEFSGLLGNSIVAGIAFGISTGLVGYLLFKNFPGMADIENEFALYLPLALLPLTYVELFTSFLIVGKQRLLATNTFLAGARGASAILMVLACLIRPNLTLVVLGMVSYSVFRLVLNIWYLWRHGWLTPIRLSRNAAIDSISYGIRSKPQALLTQLTLRLDILVLAYFVPLAVVGPYSIGAFLSEFVWYPGISVGFVLLPMLTARSNAEEGARHFAQSARLVLICTLCMGLFLAPTAWLLIPTLWGTDFRDARLILLILLPGSILYPLSFIYQAGFLSIGRPGLASVASLITVVAYVLALLVLVPLYSDVGAAIASSIAYAFGGILPAVVFARSQRQNLSDCLLPRFADAAELWSIGSRVCRTALDHLRMSSSKAEHASSGP